MKHKLLVLSALIAGTLGAGINADHFTAAVLQPLGEHAIAAPKIKNAFTRLGVEELDHGHA